MVSEAAAQRTILETAELFDWRCYHTFDSRRSADGFPDLVLVRERLIYAELKRPGKKPRRHQVEWLDALARAGEEVYLWTLDDLHEIGRVLQRRWVFVPFGRSVADDDGEVDGPCLNDGAGSFAPASAWIRGHGRRDA